MRKPNAARIELYDRSWLLQARAAAQLRQEDIASACGISVGTYCKIEKGVSVPNVRIAIQIADVLGTDVRNFLTERRIA